MFKFFKKFKQHYKLISHTTAEIFRLEEIIEKCHNKTVRHETMKKLIGVRLFFTEITGKSWKSQKPSLRAENFNVVHNPIKKT